jgi:hypothetical protein
VDSAICRKGQVEYKYFITSIRSILILYIHHCFDLENLLSWIDFLNISQYYCVSIVWATYRADWGHDFLIIEPQLNRNCHLEGLLISARQQSPVSTQILFLSL